MREWWNGGKCSRKGSIPITICCSSVSTKEYLLQCVAKSGPNSHTYSIAMKAEIIAILECWQRIHYMRMIFCLIFLVLLGRILHQSLRDRSMMFSERCLTNSPESAIVKAWISSQPSFFQSSVMNPLFVSFATSSARILQYVLFLRCRWKLLESKFYQSAKLRFYVLAVEVHPKSFL